MANWQEKAAPSSGSGFSLLVAAAAVVIVQQVLADMRRAQANIHDAKQLVKARMQEAGPRVPMRSGQANMDKIYLTSLRGDADLVAHSIRNLDRGDMPGDKVARANRWIELVHAGRVYVVEGDWNDAFFAEMESFPRGAHDDQIDAISVAVALGHALDVVIARRKQT